MRTVLLVTLALLPWWLVAEDRLELHNGQVLVGTYLGGTSDEVRFAWASSEQVVPRSQVKRLDLAPSAVVNVVRPVQVGAASAGAVITATDTEPAGIEAPGSTVSGYPTLRLGTVLMVTLGQSLDSRTSRVGQQVLGTLASDVSIDGVVVLPRGTQVHCTLHEARDAGNLFGSSELQVVVTAILIDNTSLACATDAAGVQGDNSTYSTVRNVGAGAAIGGIIDGSDGALIGTVIGGAVSLLSRGEQVRLPAGSVLDFRLVQPFTR